MTATNISVALLHDCQQLIREFFPLLRIASSQTYISALAFVLKGIELLKFYHGEFQSSVKVLCRRNVAQSWNACFQTIDEHTAMVV